MTSMPTRIETDLYDAAQQVGAVMSRSAAQQINHWARIGRELEAAHGVRQRDIARVLAGRGAYDSLAAREQAVVRAEWEERVSRAIDGLDLEAEFVEAKVDWVDGDADGRPVERHAG